MARNRAERSCSLSVLHGRPITNFEGVLRIVGGEKVVGLLAALFIPQRDLEQGLLMLR
ncbi:MAG: hypothetical protein QOH71_1450 [Blastocatellia bacterium]|jgi:hypothetical protein|nr:hypothetical protein [Blastocatellia bacterium]